MLKLLVVLAAVGCSSKEVSSSKGSGSAQTQADEAAAIRSLAFQINGHIIVLKDRVEFAEYRDVIATSKQTVGVVSAEPFIFSEATAVSPASNGPIEITMKGVEPSGPTTTALAPLLKQGTFILATKDEAPPRIVIADGLAKSLVAKVGDDITITEKPIVPALDARLPRPHVFRVAGVIHTGIEEYDQQLTYVGLAAQQETIGRGDTVMGIELRVADYKQSAAIAKKLDAALGGPPYKVQDWREFNPGLAD